MRAALRLLLIAALGAGTVACKKNEQPQEQNIVIDSGNTPAYADIEALPPDESSGTSTNELENGADNPDVNEATSNGY